MHYIYLIPVNCGESAGGGGGPMITEDIGNMTVALGREATLKCVVTHLSDYKVTHQTIISSVLIVNIVLYRLLGSTSIVR